MRRELPLSFRPRVPHPLHIVDVFADRAFSGNPLAVVLDDDFTDEQRKLVAAEMNFSETTFARSAPC